MYPDYGFAAVITELKDTRNNEVSKRWGSGGEWWGVVGSGGEWWGVVGSGGE